MNYRKNYIHIINNAKKQSRIRKRSDQIGYIYYERHHILPKSIFPLWVKRKSNIVLLTPREHFICHYLLCKIYENHFDRSRYYKMVFAFSCMCSLLPDKRYCNSRLYNAIRQNLSAVQSECLKKNNVFRNAIEKAKVKVIALETEIVYDSISEAARKLGLANGACISEVINGNKRSVAGIHFQRYDEYLKGEYPKCYVYEKAANLKRGKGMVGRFGSKSPSAKKVIRLDTFKVYNSIKDASKEIGSSAEAIALTCRRVKQGNWQRTNKIFVMFYDPNLTRDDYEQLLLIGKKSINNSRLLKVVQIKNRNRNFLFNYALDTFAE